MAFCGCGYYERLTSKWHRRMTTLRYM